MKTLDKHSTLRELREIFSNKIVIISYLALTSLSIISGPFGTYQQIPFLARIPYWAGVIGVCFAIPIFVHCFVKAKPNSNIAQKIILEIIMALLIAIMIALFLFVLNSFIWGDIPTLPDFVSYLMLTIPISLTLTVVINIFASIQESKSIKQEIPFLRRFPKHLGKDILYLSVQDHYVEVVTNKGSHLILMRFSDALDELKELNGVQIHRSFWVNSAFVKSVSKVKGKMSLIMSDGEKLPVSRTHLANVKKSLQI